MVSQAYGQIRLHWKRKPDSRIVRSRMLLQVDGDESEIELGANVTEHSVLIRARTSVGYQTGVTDQNGEERLSEWHTFRVGDLIPPDPEPGPVVADTELGHELVKRVDVDVEEPAPLVLPVPVVTEE